MYEKLIKRLRDSEHEIDCSLCDRDCCYPDGKVHGKCIIIEAADAIEAFSKMEKTTQWIPVTERLPEHRINQNTLDFEYVLCATTFGDVRPFKYGRRIGQGDAHFWNGAGYVDAYVTHWMPLPEPPKEDAI